MAHDTEILGCRGHMKATQQYYAHSDALLDASCACAVGENVAEGSGGVAISVKAMEMDLVIQGIVNGSCSSWVGLEQAVEHVLDGTGDVEVVGSGSGVDLKGPIDVDHFVGLAGSVQDLTEAFGRSLDSILVECWYRIRKLIDLQSGRGRCPLGQPEACRTCS